MAQRANIPPARPFALVTGIAYLLIATWEAAVGGFSVLNLALFDAPPILNFLHWVLGFGALGGYLAGERVSKMTARGIGVVFLLVAFVGLIARAVEGGLLGYSVSTPVSYLLIHFVTAAVALWVGFAGHREVRPRRRRTTA